MCGCARAQESESASFRVLRGTAWEFQLSLTGGGATPTQHSPRGQRRRLTVTALLPARPDSLGWGEEAALRTCSEPPTAPGAPPARREAAGALPGAPPSRCALRPRRKGARQPSTRGCYCCRRRRRLKQGRLRLGREGRSGAGSSGDAGAARLAGAGAGWLAGWLLARLPPPSLGDAARAL